EVIVADDFGANEAAFEVCVNDCGGLGGCGANTDGPGAYFFYTGGEVGLQVEQLVTGTDHAVQARLVHTHLVQEHGHFFVFQLGNFRFELVTNRHHHGVLGFSDFAHGIEVRVVLETVFIDVGDVHGGFDGEQTQLTHERHLVFIQVHAAHGL